MDLDKIERIDTGLSAQGLRYPVYEYIRLPKSDEPKYPATIGKFEQFLSGKKDFENEARWFPLQLKADCLYSSRF